MKQKVELLAPAGDRTSLAAALNAGCDAVYLGMKSFNMRGAPTNFTASALRTASKKCHEHGVKLYVTVNTIIYDRELASLRRLLKAIAPYVDAVICWDPSVIQCCREYGVSFHISTQASIANSRSAAFYKELGAERVVLARECTLAEIVSIKKATGLQVEVFAHGAQCVSVSGRCFLSQDTFGHSGNRGECLQNCRRAYRVICQDDDGDYEVTPGDNHVFSAKDLCTLPFLDKLLDAGVDSLKIEGRNRPPDYVATVISAYREAIDAWRNAALTDSLKAALVAKCSAVFNREFSTGFFLGRPITEFTNVENNAATKRRALVGKVLNYYKRPQIANVWLRNGTLSEQDEVIIMGPTTGVVTCRVENIRFEIVPDLQPQTTATFACKDKVRANDLVYKVLPANKI